MYILFGSDRHYPSGGMNDFIGAYETVKLAIHYALLYESEGLIGVEVRTKTFGNSATRDLYCTMHRPDWWHVFCTETMQIVAKSSSSPFGSQHFDVTPHGVD